MRRSPWFASFARDRTLCAPNVGSVRYRRQLRSSAMTHRKLLVGVVATLVVLLGACVVAPPTAPPQLGDRQTDPVVLTGAHVRALAGVPIGEIICFRYRNGAWKQAPIQIDQRKIVELNTVYNKAANTTNPVNVLVYADPNTFVGAGTGLLGNDDEIAFMAADTGDV